MKAVYYTQAEKFTVREVDMPAIKDNQVLLKVKSCGVCRTDVHLHHGEFMARYPLIPGHEFVGEVAAVGKEAVGFAVGDRVCADNTELCGHCYYCRRNQPLYCENFYSLGVNWPGGFAEYVAVNHDKVFPLHELRYDQGVMVEPTACAVHGLDVIGVRPGDDVLLFGTGPTGLILAQLLKHAGAARLVVAASDERKLQVAQELGADETVKLDRRDHSVHERALGERFPQGFDVVIDATGAKEVIQQLPKFAKKGAKLVIYGVASHDDEIAIRPYEIFQKELKIIGSFAQTHCFDRAISYIRGGIVRTEPLITHRYPLEEFGKAMEQVESGRGHIKVVVDIA
ncbi:zinc-dependent alcohol dehydrogenase family protein [Cohnella hongkongensis]|uniref:Zinc-dependent alcohol dehydrogenase family protein n=1 Tax=Cohnella hongkongensis TaxID=178337 RepID=A0ABV9FCZ9_9BACL